MPTNFAPPINVSPLIRFGRWSLLLLGISYGAFWQSRFTKKEFALKDIKAREKTARDARLAQERDVRNAEVGSTGIEAPHPEIKCHKVVDFKKTPVLEVFPEIVSNDKEPTESSNKGSDIVGRSAMASGFKSKPQKLNGNKIVVEGRGTRVIIDGLSGDEKVSIKGAKDDGERDAIVIEGKEGRRIVVQNKLSYPRQMELGGKSAEKVGKCRVEQQGSTTSVTEIYTCNGGETVATFDNVVLDDEETVITLLGTESTEERVSNISKDEEEPQTQEESSGERATVEATPEPDLTKVPPSEEEENPYVPSDDEISYPFNIIDISEKKPSFFVEEHGKVHYNSDQISHDVNKLESPSDEELGNDPGLHRTEILDNIRDNKTFLELTKQLNTFMEQKVSSFLKTDTVINFFRFEKRSEDFAKELQQDESDFEEINDFFLSSSFAI